MRDEQWDETLDVDLKGMMRLIRAATPAMRERQSGAILLILQMQLCFWLLKKRAICRAKSYQLMAV